MRWIFKLLLMAVVLSTLNSQLSTTCHAQLSYVDTTTPSANNPTNWGTITIPGVATNAPFSTVNTSVFVIGTPTPTAFNMINGNFLWIYDYLMTNSFFNGGYGTSTNLAGGALDQVTNIAENVSGNGTDTNAVRIMSGSAFNLTATNPVTLYNPTPYYTSTSFNPTNFPPDTNGIVWCDGTLITNAITGTNMAGPYYFDSTLCAGAMTNGSDYMIVSLFPPANTNSAGPFNANTNYPISVLTNASGFTVLSGYTGTNYLDGYYPDAALGPGVYTNDNWFVVFTTGICPNQNGPYYIAPAYGAGAMTNSCGEITYVYSSTPSSNQIYGVTSIDVTNAPAQHYTNLDAANLIFAENYTHPGITTNLLVFGSSQDGIYFVSPPYDWFNQAGQNINVASGSPTYWDLSVAGGYFYAPNPPIPPSSYTIYPGGTALFRTNNPTCWSLYQSNAWRFYMATNVALAPFPFETITTTGLVSQMFYVTNVSVFPNSNTVYTASDGSSVVFNEAPVGFTTILGVTWNQIPAPTNIIYVVTPPMSAPPTPPTTPTPSPIGGGNHYVMAQVSGVWKYLPEGNEYITQVGNMNLDQGRLSIPPKYPLSYLLIDSGGNASLIIKGRTSAYLSWLDWNPQIPSDAFYPYVNSAPSINTGVRGLYSN